MTQFVAWAILRTGPNLWYTHVRAAVDYRPFLGPDWTPEYTGASTIVANHSCYLDICIITVLKFPSFTPKSGIKNWPFIGQVCDLVFNSLFINRSGTPEERNKVA